MFQSLMLLQCDRVGVNVPVTSCLKMTCEVRIPYDVWHFNTPIQYNLYNR